VRYVQYLFKSSLFRSLYTTGFVPQVGQISTIYIRHVTIANFENYIFIIPILKKANGRTCIVFKVRKALQA